MATFSWNDPLANNAVYGLTQNASNNGFSDRLQIGQPTISNIINGYSRPWYKIQGVFPLMNPRRLQPLKVWEIIEINWKDFAQEVGQLQSFGWSFNPTLLDSYNSAIADLTKLQDTLSQAQKSVASAQAISDNATANYNRLNDILNKLQQGSASLTQSTLTMDNQSIKGDQNVWDESTNWDSDFIQPVVTAQLNDNPDTIEFQNTNPIGTTLLVLSGQVAAASTEMTNAITALQQAQEALDSAQTAVNNQQSFIDKNFSNLPIDTLGLTDNFMHAVYTEFIKYFWGYKIGQTNPELWFIKLNSFFGNYLPLYYKAIENLVNSEDLSSVTLNTGTNLSNGNVIGGTTNDSIGYSDDIGKGQNTSKGRTAQSGSGEDNSASVGRGAVATTPQNQLDLSLGNDISFGDGTITGNAGDLTYADNVNIQTQEAIGRNKNKSIANNTDSGQTQSNASNINGQSGKSSNQSTTSNTGSNQNTRNSIDPIEIWNRIISGEGYFFPLFQNAIDYGLFDLTL